MSRPFITTHRRAVGSAYAGLMGGGVYFTDSFDSASPLWGAVNTGLGSLNVVDLQGDPFRPDYRQYLWTSDELKLYRRENAGAWSVIGTPASFATLFSLADSNIESMYLACDPNTDGYVAALVGHNFAHYYAYSTDHGTTWQKHSTGLIGTVGGGGNWGGVLSQGRSKGGSAQAAGAVVTVLAFEGIIAAPGAVLVSTDRGATWTQTHTTAGFPMLAADPYQDVHYIWGVTTPLDDAAMPGLYRSTDQGTTYSLLYNSLYLLADTPRRVSAVGAGDGTKALTLRFLAAPNSDGSGTQYLVSSVDGGAHFAQHALPALNFTSLYADPRLPNRVYLFGGASLRATDDEGVTLANKNGNLPGNSLTSLLLL